MDDLTRIKGIGAATQAKLNEAGIATYADLAAAAALPPALESVATPERWAEWRERAAAVAKETNPEAQGAADAPAPPHTPAATTPSEPARMRAVLVVRAKQDRRRRAGRWFGKEPVALNAADLSPEEIAAIEADPVLISSREERPAFPAD